MPSVTYVIMGFELKDLIFCVRTVSKNNIFVTVFLQISGNKIY